MFGTVLAGHALWKDWREHGGGQPLVPVVARMTRWLS
jgi:hypothetical protein